MTPREDFIMDLQKRFVAMGVKFVTRNLRLVGGIRDFPTIFLVDLGDEVESSRGAPQPTYQRRWNLTILAAIMGSNEDKAPAEMSVFMDSLRSALYARGDKVGITARGRLEETSRTQLIFPQTGNSVVAQGIQIAIEYIDQTVSAS